MSFLSTYSSPPPPPQCRSAVIESSAWTTTFSRTTYTLEQWANTWDMRFNPCKCYILSMKRAGVKSAILYTLCGQVLESVTNNPYLGVIFTDDLSFSMHVRQVCAKATRIYIRNCSQKLRKLAYTSMCRSVLEYASPIWDPYLQCDIDSLEHIQRKAARFTTRDFRQWSSVTAMMHDLQCEPLAERRTKTRVILMYLGLVRFLNRNRNRGFFQKPRKTETAISPCIRDDFLPETLKFPMSAVSKYMKFNFL